LAGLSTDPLAIRSLWYYFFSFGSFNGKDLIMEDEETYSYGGIR